MFEGVFSLLFLHLKKMLLKEMALKIKPNQKWTCMKPQLMLSWYLIVTRGYRSPDKFANAGLQLLCHAKYTPLMKNRNRSLLVLIKEHYCCMFIYYHWVITIVGGFVISEVSP
jgi:hypothetical protein